MNKYLLLITIKRVIGNYREERNYKKNKGRLIRERGVRLGINMEVTLSWDLGG